MAMTAEHSLTYGADFSDQSNLNNFDAVWIDQKHGNTLSRAEVTALQSYIAAIWHRNCWFGIIGMAKKAEVSDCRLTQIQMRNLSGLSGPLFCAYYQSPQA